MDSRNMKFGEVEYINSIPVKGSWFARMKVRNMEEAKEAIKEFKKTWKKYELTARCRGRGNWTPEKVHQYYTNKALAKQPMPRRLPMDMPCSVADYIVIYFY